MTSQGKLAAQLLIQWKPHKYHFQCFNYRPDIKKGQWTVEEEINLAKYHSEIGSLWSRIAVYLPGRTENSVKNHWNALYRSKVLTNTPYVHMIAHIQWSAG